MWFVIAVILIIIVITHVLRHPKFKGRIGEKKVQNQLGMLPSVNYKILNDVTIRGKKGTSQIDHIVLSPQGIFVLETKNYKGWIHGSENSEYWTQTIFRFKNRFRNPIKQNWGHIYTLRKRNVARI